MTEVRECTHLADMYSLVFGVMCGFLIMHVSNEGNTQARRSTYWLHSLFWKCLGDVCNYIIDIKGRKGTELKGTELTQRSRESQSRGEGESERWRRSR